MEATTPNPAEERRKVTIIRDDHFRIKMIDETGNTFSSNDEELSDFLHGSNSITLHSQLTSLRTELDAVKKERDKYRQALIKIRGLKDPSILRFDCEEYDLDFEEEVEKYYSKALGFSQSALREPAPPAKDDEVKK